MSTDTTASGDELSGGTICSPDRPPQMLPFATDRKGSTPGIDRQRATVGQIATYVTLRLLPQTGRPKNYNPLRLLLGKWLSPEDRKED